MNDLFGGRLSPLPAGDSLAWILDNAADVDTARTRAELGWSSGQSARPSADAIRWWAERT